MESKRYFQFIIKIIQGSVHLRCLVTTFILFSLVFIQKPLFAQSFDENYDYSSDWAYNPFNSNSAWQQARGFIIQDRFPYGTPFGIADETSPKVTITHKSCERWNTNPDGNRFPITLRIPSRADFPFGWQRYGDCQDGNAIIIDRATGQVREFFEYDRSDTNNITASVVRGPYYLDGLGHGSTLGERVGTSASGISLLGGAFRGLLALPPGLQGVESPWHLILL